ncbi:YigZ family protein [Gulosibacter sp. GYB002]|uniref:YigZ family protein n=1 Tax=Gulosibacter sp. GYB002 TaxID=2994391 RepID=UPI002F962140
MVAAPDPNLHSAPAYSVLADDVEHELEVKRSRFITYLGRVEQEDEAREFIELIRQEHRTARHHCSAFVLGASRQLQRSNDDGEPSGTAGAPMLEALTGFVGPGTAVADVSDTIAVVVRYFGGVLLGTGGLVRAYADSVTEALATARFITRQQTRKYTVTAPLDAAGRWENELRSEDVAVLGTDYDTADVRFTLGIPDAPDEVAALEAEIAALSQGTADLELLDTGWVDLR